VPRRAARVDNNQSDIVEALRKIPGVTVETGHHDILVGYKNRTWWFEIKNQDCVSPKTARVRASEFTKSENYRLEHFTGQYDVVWDVYQILEIIGL
jgi:hypothetical protein